ncbi:MAG: C40 family peptidase [Chlorobiaceae bacterium]|nr:C40 family peptidase [Chlorobiaceae bacterium]NTV60735.1 C40 family peptidase [Chlorobiaceae bacterium]
MAILLFITGCRSFEAGSGFDRDCKYSVKNRKSYISCIPEGSVSPVIRSLPLKVDGACIDNLFSSIGLHIGTMYRYGGKSPAGFDCSGFVQYLYEKNFRMLLPRTSGELAALGRVVPKNSLNPGDLVFFGAEGKIDHVGIFIGKERFAHASVKGVKISSMSERWYTEHYACSVRIITIE